MHVCVMKLSQFAFSKFFDVFAKRIHSRTMHKTPFYCRMRMRVTMEPDFGGVVLHSSRSRSLQHCVFLVMMAHNSQVASNSTTVSE